MTAAEINRLDYRNGTQVVVRLKDGFTYKGTWVGYLDRGGSICGILVGMSEADGGGIAEILYSKIKSLS